MAFHAWPLLADARVGRAALPRPRRPPACPVRRACIPRRLQQPPSPVPAALRVSRVPLSRTASARPPSRSSVSQGRRPRPARAVAGPDARAEPEQRLHQPHQPDQVGAARALRLFPQPSAPRGQATETAHHSFLVARGQSCLRSPAWSGRLVRPQEGMWSPPCLPGLRRRADFRALFGTSVFPKRHGT